MSSLLQQDWLVLSPLQYDWLGVPTLQLPMDVLSTAEGLASGVALLKYDWLLMSSFLQQDWLVVSPACNRINF